MRSIFHSGFNLLCIGHCCRKGKVVIQILVNRSQVFGSHTLFLAVEFQFKMSFLLYHPGLKDALTCKSMTCHIKAALLENFRSVQLYAKKCNVVEQSSFTKMHHLTLYKQSLFLIQALVCSQPQTPPQSGYQMRRDVTSDGSNTGSLYFNSMGCFL